MTTRCAAASTPCARQAGREAGGGAGARRRARATTRCGAGRPRSACARCLTSVPPAPRPLLTPAPDPVLASHLGARAPTRATRCPTPAHTPAKHAPLRSSPQCTGANPRYPLIEDLKTILVEAWTAPIVPRGGLRQVRRGRRRGRASRPTHAVHTGGASKWRGLSCVLPSRAQTPRPPPPDPAPLHAPTSLPNRSCASGPPACHPRWSRRRWRRARRPAPSPPPASRPERGRPHARDALPRAWAAGPSRRACVMHACAAPGLFPTMIPLTLRFAAR